MEDLHGQKYLNMVKQLQVHQCMKRKSKSTSSLVGAILMDMSLLEEMKSEGTLKVLIM